MTTFNNTQNNRQDAIRLTAEQALEHTSTLTNLLDRIIVVLMIAILLTLALPFAGMFSPGRPYEEARENARNLPGEVIQPPLERPGRLQHGALPLQVT